RLTQKSDLIFATECIYIDRNVVKGDLRIRQRRNGDRFKPLGVNGTKKLKDYFIDKKIPREERDSIPLLVDEDNIIWVVRYQLSEDYKITPLTKDILKLKVEYTTKYGGKLC
ncbi:MAG: tRNA lysidine(34) synthetase TilS, partial [Firmicutes bacterium]|nr:tRNA lysidine(34) synthetase TilS [Bacillota bacterium]